MKPCASRCSSVDEVPSEHESIKVDKIDYGSALRTKPIFKANGNAPHEVNQQACEAAEEEISFHRSIFDSSSAYGSPTAFFNSKLSYWQTCFHSVSFMVGSGLLCLPLALVEMEWSGLLLLILAGVVNMYTSKLLVEVLDVVRWSSGRKVHFSDLGRECFGPIGAITTSALVYISLLINCSGYLGLASALIAGITELRQDVVLFVLSLCVWTHVFAKSLKSLATFSAINVALCLWMEAVIVGDAMYPLKQLELEHSAFVYEVPDLTSSPMYMKLAYSFSLLANGFISHAIIPSFYNNMEDHRYCTSAVLNSQFGVLSMMYLPICGISYAVYGANMQAPVAFNMRNALVRNLTIALYSVHLLLSYTITLFPVQRAFEAFLSQWQQNHHIKHTPLPSEDEDLEQAPVNPDKFLVNLICRTLLVLLTILFSNSFLPSTLDVFAYMLIPSMLLSLVLPCVFYWKLCQEEAGCLDILAITAILMLAITTTVCTLTIVI